MVGSSGGINLAAPSLFIPAAATLLPLLFGLLLVLCSAALGDEVRAGRGERSGPPPVELPLSTAELGFRTAISVDEFGAKGDGLNNDTQAFQYAWEYACSSPVSVVLEIPEESVYLVTPIDFIGPCNSKVTLLIMGTVIAPSDPDVWNGLDPNKWLYFSRVNDIAVKGGGSINGMGHEWWARSCKRNATNPCQRAPKAITFHKAKHLIVQDLTLLNSQQMHVAFTSCHHVRATRLKIIAPADSPNTDGIHISASVSVVIEDSTIRTGDDCISIVSDSSNVRVRNTICGPGHGISIGSLGKSGSHDEVHDIHVYGCLITNTENGVRIKTWQGGSGYARKIVFQNIVMENVSNPMIIDQYYCDSSLPCKNQTLAVKVDEISFIGIEGTSATEDAIKFACSDSIPCERIYLQDIRLSLQSGGDAAAYCWKASGFTSGAVYPPSCLSGAGHPLNLQNVSSITMAYNVAIQFFKLLLAPIM